MADVEMVDIVVLDGNIPMVEQRPRKSITEDNGWEVCKVPTMMGIPLMAKPMRRYPGGKFPQSQPAVFMMVEPHNGLAPPEWQLGYNFVFQISYRYMDAL